MFWLLTRARSGYKLQEKSRINSIRVVCISDTHCTHEFLSPLPDGDILIHAGDMTEFGTYEEAVLALDWLNSQKHPYKIVIAGNHDLIFTDTERRQQLIARYPDIKFLHDDCTTVSVNGRDILIYGHAQVPRSWYPAFQYDAIKPADAAEGADRLWANVPNEADVLVTHGPPAYHLDRDRKGFQGCPSLLHVLWRVKPQLHVFGHVHKGRGIERLFWTPTQAAYERICSGLAGWRELRTIAGELVRTLLGRPAEKTQGRETVLANVASQLEWMDGIVRDATVIDI